jgi:protein-disulfide isomerase
VRDWRQAKQCNASLEQALPRRRQTFSGKTQRNLGKPRDPKLKPNSKTQNGQEMNINSIPTFIIGGKFLTSGAAHARCLNPNL